MNIETAAAAVRPAARTGTVVILSGPRFARKYISFSILTRG